MMQHPPLCFYLFQPLIRRILRLLFKIKIEGLNNLPPDRYILVSNHLNWIDPVLYLSLFPAAPKIVFVGNSKTTVANPLIKTFLTVIGNPLIPFNKQISQSRATALKNIFNVAKKEMNVGFFPEGRVGEEGKMCPFHKGAFTIAKKLGRLILPVGLAGAKDLYWRKSIHIRVGQPFLPRHNETDEELTIRTHKEIRNLIPEYPGDLPGKHRLKFLTNLLKVEKHPFPFDGKQALYLVEDPDGYGVPKNKII